MVPELGGGTSSSQWRCNCCFALPLGATAEAETKEKEQNAGNPHEPKMATTIVDSAGYAKGDNDDDDAKYGASD
eukprot:11214520-Lingulodinium_polyedra.AAC.1